MNPDALTWAIAQPIGNRWRGLADAYTGGTTRVTFEGRTVEYRSLAEIGQALAAGYAAENPAQRRPNMTLVRFARDGG
ncbi:MAG: hypothetical protein IT555_16570 [Acetobacteraceae bacterium]|nr:hypothetical protein [Acetobacteraceae bacterium]